MRCEKCDHHNPEDAKFCSECGHPLEVACPKCLTERIRSLPGRSEEERKQVTVMFSDREGFTPLVEKIDADGWVAQYEAELAELN